MAPNLGNIHTSEKGQSLILILVVIIIGAVIAFAIIGRTIQDIRRTGQERVSDQAGTQVETYLDGISSSTELNKIIDEDMNFILGQCSEYEGTGSSICVLNNDKLREIFGELVCDQATIKLRKDENAISTNILKDETLQVDLNPEGEAGEFNVTWSGAAHHLVIKVYALRPDSNEIYLYETGSSPIALRRPDFTIEMWGSGTATATIPYPDNPLFARIHAIGGSADISISGVPNQQITAKASCTISGIYREFVRVIPVYNALPSVFDYVLYDRTSSINVF